MGEATFTLSMVVPDTEVIEAVFDFTASQATKTLTLSTTDECQGILKILALTEWDANGAILTGTLATFSGTTITINNASTRAIKVIGR